ncbi:MAG: 2Fe-2S iron-sulfur cluster-binding protein [Geminocystis sp.]|nr:2Fe-2S iron-sulfur cluster-binding protein [Geminocystis sp.]HIK38464.1 2Fe-2S iron-sulfur cluster binding domain-containing protein [Geminocystis sp. M7585_C2015_104]MCS7146841.1 2Fe-2S iron-sulfur cluster-binding protein [Geminocystis sp.]MCX8078861.1 2Fe-2S iron-sulfur cluster-binding protein [Geminocystis sp.]MDW8115666.1 2Fe-2S iron-sulfur cluster-binding protein [Geminocystis sp.]
MTKTYTVKVTHQGQTYSFQVAENEKILDVAQRNNIDLPFSCGAGVCTTCAAKIIRGEVDQSDGMGLSPELQAEGYVLLCVAYPRSDLEVEAGKEDEVYERQFSMPR